MPDKPSVSPREWAQTAAVGIALRNAGFGLQFSMAGDEFEETAPDELGSEHEFQTEIVPTSNAASTEDSGSQSGDEYTVIGTPPSASPELTQEEKLTRAMQVVCPIPKFGGKTLGEVLQLEPNAVKWCATKFTGGEEIKAAAQLICEYALQQVTA